MDTRLDRSDFDTVMGLFKRKKAEIERKKLEKTHEIVCLYCFRNFTHDRVMFRALEALDAEGYRGTYDDLLDEYRAHFRMESAGEIAVVLDPDDFKEANKSYHLGVLSSLKDDYSNITTRRICPHCRNDLPQSAGFSPCTIISVVGAPQSGKSVYLTSLIHTLKTVTSRNFSIFCTPLNNETGRKFKYEYEELLIDKGMLPDPAREAYQREPVVFTFSFSDNSVPEVNIAFFELADDRDLAFTDIYAAYIKNSSGILFLVDPMRMGHTRAFDEPANLLGGLVCADIPAAVVITKADQLKAFQIENFIHRKFFNLQEFNDINDLAESFIKETDPNFRNALKRRFTEHGFFAVSALGSRPNGQHISSFAPVRADEPFLWILYRLGYIEQL
jgi:hypothetical protein